MKSLVEKNLSEQYVQKEFLGEKYPGARRKFLEGRRVYG